MHLAPRRAAAPVAAVALAVLLAGCSSPDDWSAPHASPAAVGTLGPGFVDPTRTPAPEGTITPVAGSWEGVRPPAGYRVALLVGDADAATTTESQAVADWAKGAGVSLKTVTVTTPDGYIDGLTSAMDLEPDLVVGVGNDLMSPLALVSASHLDQQFLTVGAQISEPTRNVTAAVWDGASLGSEGLQGPGSSFDPAQVTAERATTAVRAGVASVLSGWTGIVVWLG